MSHSPAPLPNPDDQEVAAATREWLIKAVIGLNLCPFAKAVHVKQQIKYVVCRATSERDVITALEVELRSLATADSETIDTTLLILPNTLADFADYNDFLALADDTLVACNLEGVLQLASFHPHYQFAENTADDIENYTNRSPHPILHLLREESVEHAVAAFPDASTIYQRNEATLRRLGHEGWRRLMVGL